MIYFDSAATTLQKPPEVPRAVARAMQTMSSVGRGGHPAAMAAAETVYHCRELAGRLFEAEPEQVVFTMNATHGLNLAICSLVQPGDRVVVSGFEHNAVMRPLFLRGAQTAIAGRRLFDPADTLAAFDRQLTPGTRAAVCTCVSNVFGYILPVREIAALCRGRGIPLILDASQAAGTLPVSLKGSGAAFIAMPGHKGLYGPQGTGILLCAEGGEPMLAGGTGSNSASPEMPDFLPDRLEAGTHNVCGIAGLAEGLRFVLRRTPERILHHERQLMRLLRESCGTVRGLRGWFGAPQSGVVSLAFEKLDCEEAAQRLAAAGVAVRAGLHCAPEAHRSGGSFETGTVRVSFSAFNTQQEVLRFTQICEGIFSGEKSRIPTCYCCGNRL